MIHVLYCCDSKYFLWSLISACSIARKVSEPCIFHLFGLRLRKKEILEWSLILTQVNPKCETKVYEVDDACFVGLPTWRGGYGTLLRMLAPDLLDCEWVLYLDGDTLAFGDVAELWKLRDNNYWLMGHLNPCARFSEEGYGVVPLEKLQTRYLNAGVCLMNLDAMRAHRFSSKWRAILGRMSVQPRYPDQTLLNLVCACEDTERRGLLPDAWGVYSREGDKIEALGKRLQLVHYASDAPWGSQRVAKRDVECIWWRFTKSLPADVQVQIPAPSYRWDARVRFWILSRLPTWCWRIMRRMKGTVLLEVWRGRLNWKTFC